MGMIYRARVNFALNDLGCDPTLVDTIFRQTMQIAGQQSGNSPQEVALWIASQMPLSMRASLNLSPIKGWIRSGKINASNPEVRAALSRLGLEGLLGT